MLWSIFMTMASRRHCYRGIWQCESKRNNSCKEVVSCGASTPEP